MTGQADLLAAPNEPLGGIILVPLDGITVIHRELMMEIMIPLADGNERSKEMVAWCMLVVEWRRSKPVSDGVDTKG